MWLYWRYLRGRKFIYDLALVSAGVVLVVGALTLAYTATAADRVFREQTVSTEGVVVLKTQRTDLQTSKPEVKYALGYQYRDMEGNAHQRVVDVPEAMWKRVHEGKHIPVWFAALDPTDSRIHVHSVRITGMSQWAMLISGTLLSVFGCAGLFAAVLRANRRVQVVRRGAASLGTITEKIEDGRSIRLVYTFTDERGIVRDGRTGPLPNASASSWPLGDTVVVLFHPGDVFHHELDVYNVRSADRERLRLDSPRMD